MKIVIYMVDAAPILKAVAVPMSHTQTGILKVEILGTMLVAGVLIATYGFHRWYTMMYEDWLLMQERDERIEYLGEQMRKLIAAGKEPGKDFNPQDYEVNLEDYEPPLRSHALNYLFIGLGIFLAVGGVITWIVIPA
jgi:hypothetical protein